MLNRVCLSEQPKNRWVQDLNQESHTEKLRKRKIKSSDIEQAVQNAEIIEDYPDDTRGHSCLVLGFDGDNRPLHMVFGNFEAEKILLITAYEPTEEEWENDWKTRKT